MALVVFWGHNAADVDRFLPLMVEYKKRKIETMLFFMNYDYRKLLPKYQQRIIRRHSLEVNDYSLLYGKWAKIKQRFIKPEHIQLLLATFKQKINVFDFIQISKDTKYPYGCSIIKRLSEDMGIKNIAIPHGSHAYYEGKSNERISFDLILVSSELEKHRMKLLSNSPIEIMGDPRFDKEWKKEILPKKALYLMPNYQGRIDPYEKCKEISVYADFFYIKPHPRFTPEKEKMDKAMGISDYEIVTDVGLAYADKVDVIIVSPTSAMYDFLPEYSHKLLQTRTDSISIFSKMTDPVKLCQDHVWCGKDGKVAERYCDRIKEEK